MNALGVGAVALGAIGCAARPAVTASDGSVALGVGALPGKPGYEGMRRGLELAVTRLNEAHTVTFRLQLPAAGSTSVVRIAEQLRSNPGVVGVIGHPESGNTLEALPIYADAEHAGADPVVVVSPTASSPRLSGISPWFFRVAPSDDNAAQFVARWVLDSLKSLSAAVIYRNDSYGREWSNTFSREFEKHAGIIVERDPYLTGITEWTAYAQLIARRHPDVLLFPGDAADAVEMLRALKEAHVNIPFVGGDGTEGMRSSPDAKGARFVAFFRPERATGGEGKLFLKRYHDAYHDEPDMFAALSYDAALAIGRSVLAGARTRVAVKEALERLGHGTAPIEGVVGPIAFERNHNISGRSVVVTTIGATP